MILDKNDAFKAVTTGSETLGGFADGYSDYRDMAVAAALDGHRKIYLNIVGVSDLTSTAADTETINLVSDTAVGFATAKKTEWSSGAIAKGSIAAYRKKILLPEDAYRYMRIEWDISAVGTSSAGGAFKAFLSVS